MITNIRRNIRGYLDKTGIDSPYRVAAVVAMRKYGNPEHVYGQVGVMSIGIPDAIYNTRTTAEDIPSFALPPAVVVLVSKPKRDRKTMRGQKDMYLEAGIGEVWMVGAQGHVRIYSTEGVLPRSQVIPDFPTKLAAPKLELPGQLDIDLEEPVEHVVYSDTPRRRRRA